MVFTKGMQKLAGLEALCERYRELGIDASILPEDSPEAMKQGIIKQDMGYIKVKGMNFDLATVRTGGTTRGGYSTKMGGITMASKEKIPFQYHHIVRTHLADEDTVKAKLKKKRKGLFNREIASATWQGGSMAATLNSQTELNRAIMNFITPEDSLEVVPDRKNNAVRIVFARPAELRAGLLQGFKFDRRLMPRETIDAINQIAGLIR